MHNLCKAGIPNEYIRKWYRRWLDNRLTHFFFDDYTLDLLFNVIDGVDQGCLQTYQESPTQTLERVN
jgi:hypothetical protein